MYEFLKYEVRDAMTADPVAIGPQTPLKDVEELESHAPDWLKSIMSRAASAACRWVLPSLRN